MFSRILIFLILFLPFAASSQNEWTLGKCIEKALESNLTVKQSETDVNIAGENVKRAKGELYPSLNGMATNNYNFGQRIDPFTNQFASSRVRSNSFSLNAGIDLFSGFRNLNTIKQRNLDYQASKYRSEVIKNDLALAIARAYLQILLNEQLAELAENQVNISRQQLRQTDLLVQAGSLPKGELLNVEAQLAREELNVVTADNQVTLAYLNLRQLMQLGPEEPLTIVKPELNINENDKPVLPTNIIYEQALTSMPQIKTAEYDLKSSEKAYAVARGSVSPILSLGASYGTGYSGLRTEVIGTEFAGQVQIGETSTGIPVFTNDFNAVTQPVPFSKQLDNNLNQTIGLSLTIPIFNNFSSRTSIHIAQMRMEKSNYALEQARNDLRNDVETAGTDARSALAAYRANNKAVDALELSFEYSQERFNQGILTSVEYNTEKNNLARAQSDLLQAKYDYIFKTKILDFFQGKPLSL